MSFQRDSHEGPLTRDRVLKDVLVSVGLLFTAGIYPLTIAFCIEGKAAGRISSIAAVAEIVENVPSPPLRRLPQLEDGSVAESAAVTGRAVKFSPLKVTRLGAALAKWGPVGKLWRTDSVQPLGEWIISKTTPPPYSPPCRVVP